MIRAGPTLPSAGNFPGTYHQNVTLVISDDARIHKGRNRRDERLHTGLRTDLRPITVEVHLLGNDTVGAGNGDVDQSDRFAFLVGRTGHARRTHCVVSTEHRPNPGGHLRGALGRHGAVAREGFFGYTEHITLHHFRVGHDTAAVRL